MSRRSLPRPPALDGLQENAAGMPPDDTHSDRAESDKDALSPLETFVRFSYLLGQHRIAWPGPDLSTDAWRLTPDPLQTRSLRQASITGMGSRGSHPVPRARSGLDAFIPEDLLFRTLCRDNAARRRRTASEGQEHDDLLHHLINEVRRLHDRFDALERLAADLMHLQLSAQEIVLGKRLEFTGLTRATIMKAVATEPYKGRCPCCLKEPVLTEAGRQAPGAEFDHVFHRGLNKSEDGWLICAACHAELTYLSYLARSQRLDAFHAFQDVVFELRRREQAAPDTTMK